jgi:hypothetical protein
MEDFVFTIITWEAWQIVRRKSNQVDVHTYLHIGTIELISLLSFSSVIVTSASKEKSVSVISFHYLLLKKAQWNLGQIVVICPLSSYTIFDRNFSVLFSSQVSIRYIKHY